MEPSCEPDCDCGWWVELEADEVDDVAADELLAIGGELAAM